MCDGLSSTMEPSSLAVVGTNSMIEPIRRVVDCAIPTQPSQDPPGKFSTIFFQLMRFSFSKGLFIFYVSRSRWVGSPKYGKIKLYCGWVVENL